jgi:hypothetical protein
MGLEESYEVPPPCITAPCVPPHPQGAPNVVYERAYDQYGRPIIVVHQQPPPRTQMSYTNTATQVPNPMYPGYMHTYQPPSPYPVHSTNPYATMTTAQYPGQYAHPSPGALLTTPGYYYMPASASNVPAVSTSPISTVPLQTTSAVDTTVPYTAQLTHGALSADARPVLAPLVSNSDQQHVSNSEQQHVSNSDQQHVSNTNLYAPSVTTVHTDVPVATTDAAVTLPGLTPLVSNTDLHRVSNTNLDFSAAEQPKSDTLTSVDTEPLVSFSNVTVINNSPLPGVETKFSNENEAKNSTASTAPQSEANSTESPARVKRAFNPLPRRQPTVKAYLAHEEL